MKPEDIIHAFRSIHHARSQVNTARREIDEMADRAMPRLLNEAARQMFSVEDIAEALGVAPKRVRALMREVGMNPNTGRRLLSQNASKALKENAALLEVDPSEIDFMSPLRYLPAGADVRAAMDPAAMGISEVEV